MDEIDTFKVEALDTMQKTVDALSTEIDQVAGVHRSGPGQRGAGLADRQVGHGRAVTAERERVH